MCPRRVPGWVNRKADGYAGRQADSQYLVKFCFCEKENSGFTGPEILKTIWHTWLFEDHTEETLGYGISQWWLSMCSLKLKWNWDALNHWRDCGIEHAGDNVWSAHDVPWMTRHQHSCHMCLWHRLGQQSQPGRRKCPPRLTSFSLLYGFGPNEEVTFLCLLDFKFMRWFILFFLLQNNPINTLLNRLFIW